MKEVDGWKTFDGVIFESPDEATEHEYDARMKGLYDIMRPMIKELNITNIDLTQRLLPHMDKCRGNLAIALSIGDD